MKQKNCKIMGIAAAVVAILMLCCLSFFLGTKVETKPSAKLEDNTPTEEAVTKTEHIELLSTSQSWDGVELPAYPEGKPLVKALKVVLPPHAVLPKHHHDVMSYGYVTKGDLTIIRDSDGKEVTLHAGDAVAETVSTVHYGENRGDVPTEIVVFYVMKEGLSLSDPD